MGRRLVVVGVGPDVDGFEPVSAWPGCWHLDRADSGLSVLEMRVLAAIASVRAPVDVADGAGSCVVDTPGLRQAGFGIASPAFPASLGLFC